jgi:rare lipoprotein A
VKPTFLLIIALLLTLLLSACGGHKQAKVDVPPPPAIADSGESETQNTRPSPQPGIISDLPSRHKKTEGPSKQAATEAAEDETVLAQAVPPDAKPLLVETGIASWYGAPYHNRRGSNGKIYNMHAMTAAHRTLPLGTIARVTNLKTGSSALVRITDRGPFVKGRILDLSQAAAQKLDVLRAGLAEVRLEIMQTPAPVEAGGRWAVQIGAFEKEQEAHKLASHLEQRYHTAKVLCFSSPIGDWWVRVRVLDDDRKRAEEVAENMQTSEGAVFLVRLD